MDDDVENGAVVIDNGSGVLKAGLAGSDHPSAVFSSVVGKLKQQSSKLPIREYVGNDAQRRRHLLNLSYPIDYGIISDWDSMETIWRHTFDYELRVNLEERPILLCDAPLNPRDSRAKMAQILFEKFGACGVHMVNQAILSHYATGSRTCSLVVDIGDSVTDIVPVYEGFVVHQAVQRVHLGGRDLTNHLMNLLNQGEYSFSTTGEREIVREIKERYCSVPLYFGDEFMKCSKSTSIERRYVLPNGDSITVGKERFLATDILFLPRLAGLDYPGIHELVERSINRCDINLRMDLYFNIVLSGGTSLTEGLPDRLEYLVYNPRRRVRIVSSPERGFHAWFGGSLLASLSSFDRMWVTKKEYEERGPNVIHQKCPN